MADENYGVTEVVETASPEGPGSGLVADVPSTPATPAAPSPSQVATAPGSTTQQTQTDESSQGESEAPAFTIPENDDDLIGKENEPHVTAILNLRKELRERNSRLDALSGLQQFETLGDFEVVKQYVDIGQALFTPVMENGMAKVDPDTGLQEITATPFIEMLDQQAPGYVDNLLVDILNSKLPDGSMRINQLLEWYDLDPRRYEDYKNIDALLSQVHGVISEEELSKIPQHFRDVYRTLPQEVRDDLQIMSPVTRENYLRGHKADLEAEKIRQAGEVTAQQREAEANARHQQEVYNRQVAHLTTVRTEEFNSLRQLLVDWKPTGNPQVDKLYHSTALGMIGSLLDPDLRAAAVSDLSDLGINLGNDFDAIIERLVRADANAVALDYYGSELEANLAKTEATQARQQLRAKLGSVIGHVIKTFDSGKSVPDPVKSRPLIPNGNTVIPSGNRSVATGTFSDEKALQWARDNGILS